MRNLDDLTREELASIVACVRDALFLNEDEGRYDREKEWDPETIEAVAEAIIEAGLAPDLDDAGRDP